MITYAVYIIDFYNECWCLQFIADSTNDDEFNPLDKVCIKKEKRILMSLRGRGNSLSSTA